MKCSQKIIVLLLFAIAPLELLAQLNTSVRNKPGHLELRWKKMQTAGIILTSLGAVCEAAAIAMYVDGKRQYKKERSGEVMPKHAPLNMTVGEIGIYGGAFALAGGITSYIVGNSKLKKMRNISIQPGPKSIYLGYRF